MENLEFLTDVVPKTTTFRQHKQKQRQAPEQQTTSDPAEGSAPNPAPGQGQGLITADGRLVISEVTQKVQPSPVVEVPAGPMGAVEAQATNGASHDVMDVDGDDEGSMHTADDGRGRTESVTIEDEDMGD